MLHFIYNPCAGKGKAKNARIIVAERLKALGVEHKFHRTTAPRDAKRIAAELTREGADSIVAIGGDGTLNEVLNGLQDPGRVKLGLIPSGSGNDFASAAGLPLDPLEALRIILDGEARPTDFMDCSGVRGINLIGAGIDVDILRVYEKLPFGGPPGYLTALIKTLFNFRFYEITEQFAGKSVSHRALIACAGNGKSCGGGITLCPEASLDDGLMDIVIVEEMKKSRIPASFLKLMKKQILTLPQTVFRRSDRLTITSEHPLPVQIDGEIYDSLPFDVRLISEELRFFRP